MNKREAVVIGAYTGILMGDFDDMHEYIEEIMERPVFTHELASQKICDEIKELSKLEFLRICKSAEEIN